MSFLAIIEAIAGLIPAIISLIMSVESAIPQSGAGTTKLNMVVNTLRAANAAATNALPSFETIVPAIQSTISGIVAAFNAAGIFKTPGSSVVAGGTGAGGPTTTGG